MTTESNEGRVKRFDVDASTTVAIDRVAAVKCTCCEDGRIVVWIGEKTVRVEHVIEKVSKAAP